MFLRRGAGKLLLLSPNFSPVHLGNGPVSLKYDSNEWLLSLDFDSRDILHCSHGKHCARAFLSWRLGEGVTHAGSDDVSGFHGPWIIALSPGLCWMESPCRYMTFCSRVPTRKKKVYVVFPLGAPRLHGERVFTLCLQFAHEYHCRHFVTSAKTGEGVSAVSPSELWLVAID